MVKKTEQERLIQVIEQERKVLGELRKSEARRAEEMRKKANELQSKVNLLTDILKGAKTTGDSLSNRLYWLNWLVALGTICLAIIGGFSLWVQIFNN